MINYFHKFGIALLLTAIATFANANLVQAQEKTAELPSVDKIIARYVEATGGLEKYKTIKTMRQQGTMSIPAAGINGKMDLKVADPNKLLVSVELPGAGNEASGSDGETVWSESTMTGNRIVTGKEADQTLLQADFRRMYDPAAVYKSMKCIGIEEVNGEDCYKVELEMKSGDLQLDFYSIETGLQTKASITAQSAMGAMQVDSYPTDYKEVDGIKIPHKMTQELPNGMKIEVEFTEIELNPEFEDATFALPKSIQKLVEKQKEKAAAKKEDADADKDDDSDKKEKAGSDK